MGKKKITSETLVAFTREKRMKANSDVPKEMVTQFKKEFDTYDLICNPFTRDIYDDGIVMMLLYANDRRPEKLEDGIKYAMGWAFGGARTRWQSNSVESVSAYKLRKFKEDHGGRSPKPGESYL
jgi:hypothetical protein